MRKTIVAVIVSAVLAGCSAVGSVIDSSPGLKAQTREDLDAAIKIADGAGDKVASACFKALKDNVSGDKVVVEIKGPVSAYAKLRVDVRGARSDVPEAIHVACAPLVVDAGKTAAGLGLLFK